jgi:ribosomal protein L11 methyltransferase
MNSVSASARPSKAITYQATITTSAGVAERIAAALEAAHAPVAMAVGLFDLGGGRFEVSAHYADAPARDELIGLIRGVVNGEALDALRVEPLANADWVTLSQSMRGPVRAGRFLIHGSHDRARVLRQRLAIEIDAGQAFGTAHHASTRGCLLALDRMLKHRRPKRVLDIGTGTGVLAIAAAKALRRKVLASDNDPLAVAVAAKNAKENGVAPLVRVLRATGLGHRDLSRARADLVLANLLQRALLDLAPVFARSICPRGAAVLSGITEGQSKSVEARFRSLGFILKRRIVLDGWTTLVLTRRSPRKSRVRD